MHLAVVYVVHSGEVMSSCKVAFCLRWMYTALGLLGELLGVTKCFLAKGILNIQLLFTHIPYVP